MVIMPPRPNWPAEATTTLFVFVGSKFGVGTLPGTRKASSRKLRPFRGSRSMAVCPMTPSTVEEPTVARSTSATASTASAIAATATTTSSRTVCPTSSRTPFCVRGAKPEASATRV